MTRNMNRFVTFVAFIGAMLIVLDARPSTAETEVAPLETQAEAQAGAPQTAVPILKLAGVILGTRAFSKDNFNRLDPRCLVALYGNPTALVAPATPGSITLKQQPPGVTTLFSATSATRLPNWAAGVTFQPEASHVHWLYRREVYTMGFRVNRDGVVDAIAIAGASDSKAPTKLETANFAINLGDDTRKVRFRFESPKDYPAAPPETSTDTLHYRIQNEDLVFTIRDNRVVRISIASAMSNNTKPPAE